MTDGEYVFHQTNGERKRNGYGAYNKKRRGGNHVRLTSDHLTKGELKKLNGEEITYQLDRPRTYVEFKELPEDIRKDYITHLVTKYGVGPSAIAKMMGISYWTIKAYTDKMGLTFRKGKRLTDDEEKKWAEFVGVKEEPTKEVEVTESPKIEVGLDDLVYRIQDGPPRVVVSNTASTIDFMQLITLLKSSGASISLKIAWDKE